MSNEEELRDKVKLNDVEAMIELADTLKDKHFAENKTVYENSKYIQESHKLLKQATNLGSHEAMYLLAQLYEYHNHIFQDAEKKAIELYEKILDSNYFDSEPDEIYELKNQIITLSQRINFETSLYYIAKLGDEDAVQNVFLNDYNENNGKNSIKFIKNYFKKTK
jgi:TPR repeat protein